MCGRRGVLAPCSLSPNSFIVGGEGWGEGAAVGVIRALGRAFALPPHPTLSPERARGRGLQELLPRCDDERLEIGRRQLLNQALSPPGGIGDDEDAAGVVGEKAPELIRRRLAATVQWQD